MDAGRAGPKAKKPPSVWTDRYVPCPKTPRICNYRGFPTAVRVKQGGKEGFARCGFCESRVYLKFPLDDVGFTRSEGETLGYAVP